MLNSAAAPETNEANWNKIITSYKELIHQYHWPFQPMLALVQELSCSAPVSLYPDMSHEHLGFSLVHSYPECVQMPQVWISYLPQRGAFEVMFRESLKGPQSKVVCQQHEVKRVAEKALAILLERKLEPD